MSCGSGIYDMRQVIRGQQVIFFASSGLFESFLKYTISIIH